MCFRLIGLFSATDLKSTRFGAFKWICPADHLAVLTSGGINREAVKTRKLSLRALTVCVRSKESIQYRFCTHPLFLTANKLDKPLQTLAAGNERNVVRYLKSNSPVN